MSNLVFHAMVFAREVHADQKRKYTHNPYAEHLAEVAGIVSAVAWSHPNPEDSLSVSWLHDSWEDAKVTPNTLMDRFGVDVMQGVMLLSDVETGNRAARKAASRARLAQAPAWVQDIKVADIMSNTASVELHDPEFALIYLPEKRLQLEALSSANPALLELAWSQIGHVNKEYARMACRT